VNGNEVDVVSNESFLTDLGAFEADVITLVKINSADIKELFGYIEDLKKNIEELKSEVDKLKKKVVTLDQKTPIDTIPSTHEDTLSREELLSIYPNKTALRNLREPELVSLGKDLGIEGVDIKLKATENDDIVIDWFEKNVW